MAQSEPHDAEVIQSEHRADRDWSAPRHRWLGSAVTILALFAGAAAYGWSAWSEAADERARSGEVSVGIEAPLPFSADSGAAEGILRLRNDGPLALAVLTMRFRSDRLRLVTENLPLRIDAASNRLVVVRFELDCTASGAQATAGSIQVRARTADKTESIHAVRVRGLPAILDQMHQQECEPHVLPLAEELTFSYAGITEVTGGHITTRVLIANDSDAPVSVAEIRAVSGWPRLDPASSSDLPVTVPANAKLPVDLGWDVSRCVRSQSGRFSSGLLVRLGPPANSEELAVLEPGIDYTRDFFRRYGEVCP